MKLEKLFQRFYVKISMIRLNDMFKRLSILALFHDSGFAKQKKP